MDQSNPIATTPSPPYYSVIFTSCRADIEPEEYGIMAQRMLDLASQQDGYLGVESVRDAGGVGITVSYWRDLAAISNWHSVAEHREAQRLGRERWYDCFTVRICKVDREYSFRRD